MILVTGASGFIGKQLISALTKVYGSQNVVALTSKPIPDCNFLLHNDYTFEKDFFLKSAYSSINTIVHSGAYIPKSSSNANDWIQCNTNIKSTDCLLKSSLPNLKKFVLLSTVDVYGEDNIITETSPIGPVSLYAHSKFYVEMMVSAWAKSNNIDYQILRVGHVYGPGEERYQKVIPITMKRLLKNEPLELYGNGSELRSFIYVNDALKAIMSAVKLVKASDLIVNVASEQRISILELFRKLIEISGQDVPIKITPNNSFSRNLIFDTTKLRMSLLSSETSLNDGLISEWNYMKERSNENFA